MNIKKTDYKSFVYDEKNYFFFFISVLLAYCIYNLFHWPVIAGDTDLWYHLNGGRYFFEHLKIPDDSFFSFIEPSKKWVDYYWLFQVFVFKIFQYSGYYGLVCLRAFLFMGLMYFVLRHFLDELHKKQTYFLIGLVFPLYLLLLLSRYSMIRPHMFSYFFIAVFIYILECKRKYVFLLPFLATLWVNIHGIVYPVILLIILAYLVELVIERIRERREIDRKRLLVIVPLVLVLFTVYCTPHGIHLVGVPMTPTDFASHYIIELQKFSFTDLSSIHFIKFIPQGYTVFVVILILACLACFQVILTCRMRLAHLILFAGGLFLLARGRRFALECALLAMPLMKDAILNFSGSRFSESRKPILPLRIALLCILCIIPILSLYNDFKDRPKLPFSNNRLPYGVAAFLQKVNAGGTLLNHPNMGGYFQWVLYPRYKIFMDMEVPFLFSDEDMFVAGRMFTSEEVLSRVLMRYRPVFITVPIRASVFPGLIRKHSQYRPVFFDDSEVLYVDESQSPSIAGTYCLEHIEPFSFSRSIASGLGDKTKMDMISTELERMYRIVPDNFVVNRGLSMIALQKGDYAKAIAHADMIIRDYPESHVGYAIKGDALKGSGELEKALKNYEYALKRTDGIRDIYRDIGLIYFEKKMYSKAYRVLTGTANLFGSDTSYRDVYYIAYSATMANHEKDADILFEYGLRTLPADDKEWIDKYEKLRLMLKNDKESVN